jgi:hypothetical protein
MTTLSRKERQKTVPKADGKNTTKGKTTENKPLATPNKPKGKPEKSISEEGSGTTGAKRIREQEGKEKGKGKGKEPILDLNGTETSLSLSESDEDLGNLMTGSFSRCASFFFCYL